ncbi:S-layer homology domain-containing protein [Paenibacillus xylanivorans]|uniref:S-layer homology domain-containing protein n=1 Tax=Paenibacillus xylanivorans TaxID=1705561 RepID=UPI0006B17C78|nr:S-layer homology domain-containing protein [Paenibacillus xylanivorans]
MIEMVLKKTMLLLIIVCLVSSGSGSFMKMAYADEVGAVYQETSSQSKGGENDWKQDLKGVVLEAEAPENILTGNASITDSPISSGSKKVSNLYQGSSLQFPAVNVPAAGTYLIRISYISGDLRPVYMKVNEGPDEMIDLPKTTNWDTLGMYDVEVALQAGSNTVTFSDHEWYSPDFDRIEVIPYSISYEAEDPDNTLGGQAIVADSPHASGGKKVGYLNNGSSLTFNNITAAMTGDYRITVAYISGDPRSFYVSSNGGAEQYYELPKTADWDTVGTYDLILPLNEGNNTIAFTDGNWYAPDIDRIIVEPAKGSEPEIPGEEEGDLGNPEGSRSYGSITVTDYTYGLLVSNGQYEMTYNTGSGFAGYSWADGQKVKGVYGTMKLGNDLLETKGYESHINEAPIELEDGFGKGIELTFVHMSAGKPTLKQVYKFYENKTYFLTRLDAVSDTEMKTNYMSPVTVKRTGGVDIGQSADNRVLTVPFDNDAWIRYKSQSLNRTDTSYEMTAVFNNTSRNGLVLGSVTHDDWKTGIDWSGSSNRLNTLSVYGGVATDVTRDTQPHGSLSGTELSSPLIMVGGFSDYRTGLEEYGKANAIVTPPLELNPELPQGVPVGWNSWGAYGSSLSYQNVVDVSNYFKKNLKDFNNNGNVFINMDSYWDNLSDEQLAQAVSVIKGNDQHAGIYWAPFVYWGNNMSQPVEGTDNQYTYGDIVLKDAAGIPLPTLDGAFPLDVTHPGSKMRMDYYLDKFKDLGFTFIKLDFLTHGSLEGQHDDPNVTTGIQAYNVGMRYVKDRLDGKMFISESIAPIFPSQYAHSRRISCDAYGKINETEYVLNSLTYGFWQNGTIYPYTDPDHLALGHATSLIEAQSRLNSGIISGTVLMDSDDVNDPKSQEYMTALYNNTEVLGVALKGKVFKPLEGNTGANAADTFVMKDGDDYYLAVFNYSANQSVNKTIDLDRAGLSTTEAFTSKDLWTGQVSSLSSSVTLPLQPAESKLLKLTANPKKVTGVVLDKTTVELTVGEIVKLTATVEPDAAANQAVTWSTNDSAVATVDNGTVTAVKAGKATISVETVDGGFKRAAEITVKAASTGNPENPGNPALPGDNGNNGNTGNSSPSNANGSAHTNAAVTLMITADMLKTDHATGKMIVELTANTQEVQLSSAVIRQLKDNTLEVRSGKLSLEVPADLIRQLQSKVSADQLEGSVISLKLVSLGDIADKTVAAIEETTHANVKLKGNLFEFDLSITAKDGQTKKLSTFEQPITLRFKAVEDFDSKLGGIYYIGDNGKLEYVPAEFDNGVLKAEISHFSKYAILELNQTFTDVPASHWASAVIKELAAKLMVQGTGKDNYEPGRPVTRAEFTALLIHALGLNEAGDVDFTDVDMNAWYAKPVSIAYKSGIVSGKSTAKFEPDAQITREEVTVMLMKAYRLKNDKMTTLTSDPAFADMNDVSSWAVASVREAANLGLVQGQSKGKFVPKDLTSRAEAAQVIYNLILK